MNAFIGLGSNLGDKKKNIDTALKHINKIKGVKIEKKSSLYNTSPVGYLEQDDFINMVCMINTDLSPKNLLNELQQIEKYMGRGKNIKWGPRIIDLDILLYDDRVLNSETLQIPHKYMHERKFVLEPLTEIAQDIMHPVFKKNVVQLLEESESKEIIKKSHLKKVI